MAESSRIRKSSATLTLTILGPTLLAAASGCRNDRCNPRYEQCTRTSSGTYIHAYRGGAGGGRSGVSSTGRGGFGGGFGSFFGG
jgi:hypothetical protein